MTIQLFKFSDDLFSFAATKMEILCTSMYKKTKVNLQKLTKRKLGIKFLVEIEI